MKPLMLQIQKKTLAPAKYNTVHQYHTAWRMAGVLSYSDTARLFKCFGQGGVIETDAQFARLLKDNVGLGIFSIKAFVKGRRGFYSFMKVEISESTYRQLPKKETADEVAVRKARGELHKLTKESKKEGLSDEQKETISESLDSIKEDVELSKEIAALDSAKRGCRPYLHPIKQIYYIHSYDEYRASDLPTHIAERTSVL